MDAQGVEILYEQHSFFYSSKTFTYSDHDTNAWMKFKYITKWVYIVKTSLIQNIYGPPLAQNIYLPKYLCHSNGQKYFNYSQLG